MRECFLGQAVPPGKLIRYESRYSFVKQAKKAEAKVKPIAQAKADKVECLNLFYRSLDTNKGFHRLISNVV